MTAPLKDNEDVLLFWQKKLFKHLFIFLLIIGSIPYLLSCKFAFEFEEYYRIFFYTLIYLYIAAITFVEKIPFHLRLWAGISGFYFLGLFSIFSAGLVGSARIYLICFTAFVTIFSGLRAGLFSLFLNMATLSGFGYLYVTSGHLTDPTQGPLEPMAWVVVICTFSFLSAAVTIVLSLIIRALEKSAKEYSHLIQNSSDIIWTMDAQHRVTFVNSAVSRILGFSPKEMIGRSANEFFSNSHTDFTGLLEKNSQLSCETILLHKLGHPVDVDISITRINSFSKTANEFQGLIRDISQKKQQEREAHRIKEKKAQAEKLESLGILAGSVAHDLNNILSGISTYPEVLLMDNTLDPKIRQGLSLIQDSGKKASAVVSDLLTVSRGSSAQKEILNLNTMIEKYLQAHDFQEVKQTYPNVSIDVQAEPELLNMNGSYIHLEKTIMNLLINAVEEVAEKIDAQVDIITENNFIDPSTPEYENMAPGEYVLLKIKDNGSGIPSSHIKKIFDPFFTKKEMGKSGTGLGLTVVWNAVQDHNGHIFVSSDKTGTCFTLLFPAVRQAISEKSDPFTIDEIKGQGEFILVVDDLKEQQKIALTILDSLGYTAKAVDNGYAAAELIKSSPVDLVILDMIMTPSISGLETYQMIKKIQPDQKAIIASGYSESSDVIQVQKLGAGSFVKKPYTILDMGIAIKEELKK
jgi:two-component system cell cycle sensor histidine kinase/response regulator CckA